MAKQQVAWLHTTEQDRSSQTTESHQEEGLTMKRVPRADSRYGLIQLFMSILQSLSSYGSALSFIVNHLMN